MARPEERLLVGWREWVALPDLGILGIKAKIDTGARTSSLHAVDFHLLRRHGRWVVRFKVNPLQHTAIKTVEAEARMIGGRHVRNSSGQVDHRVVVETTLEMQGQRWPIELTLASRDTLGFRMLLGRQALRGHAMVDPGRSFLTGPAGRHGPEGCEEEEGGA
ncbi:MAG: ATP-dependent zinc protease [Planctomycetes bacterium]|nr:ATP-dependent zinc protease [Planctomycetota bacterium]